MWCLWNRPRLLKQDTHPQTIIKGNTDNPYFIKMKKFCFFFKETSIKENEEASRRPGLGIYNMARFSSRIYKKHFQINQ